jgi:spermidine synthase
MSSLVALLAGAAALVVELVWMRLLSLALGSASIASGAVVASLMLGMGIGSAWSPRFRGRAGAVLGRALLLLAGCAILSSPVVHLLGHPGLGGTVLLGLAMTAASIPMGMVVPLLAAGRTPPGVLYAWNTLGSAAGSLVTGFLLLPALGNAGTLRIAAILLALLGTLLALRKEADPAPSAPPATPGASGRPGLLLVLYGFSALAAMGSEIGWMRALVLSIGSSTYAFTVVLTVYIAGLGVGSALAARWKSARPSMAFGLLQFLLSVTCLGSLLLLGRLPRLLGTLVSEGVSSLGSFALVAILVAATALLLPAILVGAAFPIALRWAAERADPSRASGHLLAAATGGSTLGALLASFVSIPLAGVERTLGVALLLHAMVGSLVLSQAEGRRRLWPSLVAATLLALVVLKPSWDPRILQSGPYINEPASFSAGGTEAKKLLFARDDRVASVAVFELPDGNRILRIDGKTDASMTQIDQVTQLLTAHIPLSVHGKARTVAVVGLGSGMTVASCLRYEPDDVHVIEISPAVVRASRYFDSYTGAPLADPRVRLHVEDARAVLGRPGPAFDVIINEPSNLWIAGMAGLFTEDFYRSAASRLRPGGLMCQWIHAYGITEPVFRDAVATFLHVFPHVTLWEIVVSGDYLLLGSPQPYPIDADAMASLLARPRIADDLHWIGVRSAGALLGDLVAQGGDLAPLLAGARLQTDDGLHLEFLAPRGFFERRRLPALSLLPDVRKESLAPLVQGRTIDWAESRGLLRESIRSMIEGGDPIDRVRLLERALDRFPEDRQSRLLLDVASEQCLRAADAAAQKGDPAAARLLEAVPPGSRWYPAARFRRIARLRKDGAAPESLAEEYRKILQVAPGLETAVEPYVALLLASGFREEAERVASEAAIRNPKSPKVRVARARALEDVGRKDEAAAEWKEALNLDPGGVSGLEAARHVKP